MEFQMQDSILVVGLGGAGSRIATSIKEELGCDCLLISHDPKDLNHESSKILINTSPILNPSAYLIRGISLGVRNSIAERLESYS
ncbi:MAG: cell division protein FtsZ, partial [Thaumarchaeota archaeon]|nr:cell division protein FtsZ [Nitrososphaerota archaeon]